jgi:hypothetical protein
VIEQEIIQKPPAHRKLADALIIELENHNHIRGNGKWVWNCPEEPSLENPITDRCGTSTVPLQNHVSERIPDGMVRLPLIEKQSLIPRLFNTVSIGTP